MTELWKINEDGCIEALVDYNFYHPAASRDKFVKAGDVGAKIESFVKLPKTTERLWVGKGTTFYPHIMSSKLGSCYIGENCVIEGRARIKDDVMISDGVQIGMNVLIMSNTLIQNSVRIGYNTSIYERCCICSGARIGSSCTLGTGTKIGYNTHLWDGVNISRSNIGRDSEIKRSVSIDKSSIGDYSVIDQCVDLHSVQAGSAKIGESVKLSNTKLPDRAELNLGDHFMLAGCGKYGRNVLFFTHENEVCVSAGCQNGITYKKFKERIRNAHGTSTESADRYKQIMPIMNAIIRDLKWKIIKKKVRIFFS